ncbi:hypothetical protein J1N35_040690 [Gossypium stocksii]|uniref:Uncharacterized protein n=1 Tax=Gossypium stocksii TaxID=47602 RepID=A0A9D3UEG0_9ROSI|nr:hypothetical protein J1N35_040690 [Gossypium stocksii]
MHQLSIPNLFELRLLLPSMYTSHAYIVHPPLRIKFVRTTRGGQVAGAIAGESVWPKGLFMSDANGTSMPSWGYNGYYGRQGYESLYDFHCYAYEMDSYKPEWVGSNSSYDSYSSYSYQMVVARYMIRMIRMIHTLIIIGVSMVKS